MENHKEKIIQDITTNNKSGMKSRVAYITKNYYDDYLLINNISISDNWYEKLYCYLYNIDLKSKCLHPQCNNNVNFQNLNKGYTQYCSILCRNTDPNQIIKTKELNLDKYGVISPSMLIDVKEKIKITKFKKYGDEDYNNIKKIKETKKILFGDENYNNRKKCKETSLNKYDVSNFTNRDKAKETSLKKYNNEYYNNREKQFLTNIERYGVKVYNNPQKAIKTNLIKYGESSYNKTKEYKIKQNEKQKIRWSEKLQIPLDYIEYNGDDLIIKNVCNIHKSFTINKYVLRNRLNYGIKNICTECNPVNKNVSIKEKEIKEFIEIELNIKTEKDNKILNGKEIDIYIPTHNLGIEFDGLYWHSNIYKDNNYHLNKTNLSEENNTQLLHVFEDEWFYKKDIVKSIIKSKLGIYDQKIFARKCIIKEIESKESTEFLNINHLQGNVGSKVKLGLYYENELISLMTFGVKRISMGNKIKIDGEYEMLRFCNKLNTTVIGGASKLLSYFIKNYQPKSILSFADRRYSNGNLYKELGFKQLENTKPNYWYFKAHEYILHYRFGFRKDVLVKQGFDAQLTEHQIMDERGYLRIYDCGNMKFILYN